MLVAVFLLVQWWPPAPASPPPTGGFAFAVLGDSQYYPWEELRFHRVQRQLERSELAFVIHVGDILWRPCSEELYRERRKGLEDLGHPLVYTPGDNEWADCHEARVGGYQPRDRLERLRAVFFDHPTRSLGGAPIELESQGRRPGSAFPELVENARWERHGVVFATVHLVGSGNATWDFAGREPADDEESRRRTEGGTAWMRDAFAVAAERRARAVVLAFHADPLFDLGFDDPERLPFEPFFATLEEEAAAFGEPVLLLHGDSHELIVDRPLVRRATGEPLGNVTRLEVPGSPDVGWVRVGVAPSGADPFSFEPHVVARWRFW